MLHTQRENSRNGYGLRESVPFAVLVLMVMLLRLLTNLLMIRMRSSDRTEGSHEQQPKHKAKGSEMLQEIPEKGPINVSIATIPTCYNEHQVTSASLELEQQRPLPPLLRPVVRPFAQSSCRALRHWACRARPLS